MWGGVGDQQDKMQLPGRQAFPKHLGQAWFPFCIIFLCQTPGQEYPCKWYSESNQVDKAVNDIAGFHFMSPWRNVSGWQQSWSWRHMVLVLWRGRKKENVRKPSWELAGDVHVGCSLAKPGAWFGEWTGSEWGLPYSLLLKTFQLSFFFKVLSWNPAKPITTVTILFSVFKLQNKTMS